MFFCLFIIINSYQKQVSLIFFQTSAIFFVLNLRKRTLCCFVPFQFYNQRRFVLVSFSWYETRSANPFPQAVHGKPCKNSVLHTAPVKSYSSTHFHHCTEAVTFQNVPAEFPLLPVFPVFPTQPAEDLRNFSVPLKYLPIGKRLPHWHILSVPRLRNKNIFILFLITKISKMNQQCQHIILCPESCHIIRKTARVHRNLFPCHHLQYVIPQAVKIQIIYHCSASNVSV